MDKALKFISSLRLTVTLLSLSLVLVFVGTLAQVEQGLWDTQVRYFRSFFVYWKPTGGDFAIPVLPGGYLLGWALLVNLVAAHYVRFKFSWSKLGIFLTHVGLIFLLLGQFFTEQLQVESQMRLEEGQTKNYSDAGRRSELVVIDKSDEKMDQVVAFPESLLKDGVTLQHPGLPVVLKVNDYFANSEPSFRPPAMTNSPAQGDRGIADRFVFNEAPYEVRMDRENIPSAIVAIEDQKGNRLGTWVLSRWAAHDSLVSVLQRHWSRPEVFGPQLGGQLAAMLSTPQTFEVEDRTFEIALRPVRYYTPYSIGLLDFRHDKYLGTERPKNFSSDVRLINPDSGENREVLIKMNQPLRHAGVTYFQSSFEPDRDDVTILQVVRNPAWVTPYVAVIIVGLGLVVQFSMHLFKFVNRRKNS